MAGGCSVADPWQRVTLRQRKRCCWCAGAAARATAAGLGKCQWPHASTLERFSEPGGCRAGVGYWWGEREEGSWSLDTGVKPSQGSKKVPASACPGRLAVLGMDLAGALEGQTAMAAWQDPGAVPPAEGELWPQPCEALCLPSLVCLWLVALVTRAGTLGEPPALGEVWFVSPWVKHGRQK